MKKRLKKIHIFLFIAISLFIVALPAYLHCTNLSEANSFFPDLIFENPDQENGLADYENELKVFGLTGFSIISLPGTNLFEQSSHFFSQVFSLRHKTLVLLC